MRLLRLLRLSALELAVLVLLFTASLPAVTARLYSSDEVQYFSYLRSLWFDRDVSFENEYRYFYNHQVAQSADFHRTFLELETATGRRINYATMGCAILWLPFYAAGDVVARVLQASGRDVSPDGYSRPYVAAVAYGSAFYGFAAIVLGIAAARRIVGSGAFGSGLAVWAGTPILFYMYVAPPFSHASSAFAVALFVTIWLRVRRTWTVRGAVALGLSGALMAMVREQDIFFVAGPAMDFTLTATRAGRAAVSGAMTRGRYALVAVAGCAAFACAYLPQLVAYQALNGAPGPSPLVARKMIWHAPHALQVLGSPSHGFFFWTPLAVLCIAGLVMLALARVRPQAHDAAAPVERADRRTIGACMLLMVALQVYISGAVDSWTVAGGFGQRRFVAVTSLLVVGLAALAESVHGRIPRAALAAVVALCVWWNVALTAAFATRIMDRQRLEPRRNAYDAFVTLPRLVPDLLYRYFTHRESFYKRHEGEPAAPPR